MNIETMVNSARNSRVVEGCAAGLMNSQASTGGVGSGQNSCSHLGAAENSCDKGETGVGPSLDHSSDEVQGARKKKNLFQ